MVSEKELKETILKKFTQLWKERSTVAKKGKLLGPKDKAPIRAYGIRYQLPKTVTNETINEMVTEFLKKEEQRGLTEANTGNIYYRSEPKIEIMLEIVDEKTGKSRLFFDNPIVAIYGEAGFVPDQRPKKVR